MRGGCILRAALDLQVGITAGKRTDAEVLFDNLPEPIEPEWVKEANYLYWTDHR
jgi:hypothetical protein